MKKQLHGVDPVPNGSYSYSNIYKNTNNKVIKLDTDAFGVVLGGELSFLGIIPDDTFPTLKEAFDYVYQNLTDKATIYRIKFRKNGDPYVITTDCIVIEQTGDMYEDPGYDN